MMLKSIKVVMVLLGLMSMTAVSAKDTGMIVFETYPDVGIGVSNDDGTNLRVLASRGGNPKWFPSGDKISYYVTDKRYSYTSPWMTGETRIVDINGTLIKSVPYWVSDISSDGKRLLVQKIYQSDGLVGDEGKIYEIGVYDISNDSYVSILNPVAHHLDREIGMPSQPKWMPGGESIICYFIGKSSGKYFGIWSISDSRLSLITIPDEIGINTIVPGFDISPDGNRIVFSGGPINTYEKGSIYILDLQKHTVSLVRKEGGGILAFDPVWSKNGSEIMYVYRIPDEVFGAESSFNVISIDSKVVRPVFKKGMFHKLINAVGIAASDVMTNPDWWQPR